LTNGWILLKTEDSKSERDFRVKTIFKTEPRIRSLTPKHAHFAIDFYGKLCADEEKAMKVFAAIISVWERKSVTQVLSQSSALTSGLPGYDLEYILHALNWILEQEDINFTGRPEKKQNELDETLRTLGVIVPSDRLGSQLAVSLFCNIAPPNRLHPVDAFMRANVDVLPMKRGFGAV
jgi:hypothetical protein